MLNAEGKALLLVLYMYYIYIYIYIYIYTVEPQLSESPLSEPSGRLSEHYFEFYNTKRRLDFLQNQVINEIPM